MPRPENYPRIAATSGHLAPGAASFAVALWMNPPPSTRACPEAAS
jgi:hypothetical protein